MDCAMNGLPRRARRFLSGCAAGAATLTLCPQAASAQAFDAAPVVVSGDVGFLNGAGTSRITVRTTQAVIDWLPPRSLPNPYVFLPAGNVATFENGTANANFAVLNRIATLMPSRFDGTVIGQLRDVAGNVRPGGTILFYGPGGIIVGATALFDVGNLVLTTLNVTGQLDANSNLTTFVEPDGTIRYNVGLDPNAVIVTEAGGRIRATGEGSAVALIGPRIVHGGTTFVNGSTAYVAAQAVEMRFNQGLFDIIVTNGTDFNDAITHTGTTGGPASTGAADRHAIYMVATPNATPVQMLLSGTIGYDPPLSAAIENGEIVLSAGYDIVGGAIDSDLSLSTFGDGDIILTSGLVTSDLRAAATRSVGADVVSARSLTFLGDAVFIGDDRAFLSADKDSRIRIEGAFSATTANRLNFGSFSPDITGGEAVIFAGAGSDVTILGAARLDASAVGQLDDSLRAGAGTGGQARVEAAGGSVAIGGRLTLLATGTGASGAFPPDPGGVGTGGLAQISATNGAVTIGGGLAVDVGGFASAAVGAVSGPAAAGTGGEARIETGAAGRVTVTGGAQFAARGVGASAVNGLPDASGGAGQGGTVRLLANGGTIDLGGALTMDVSGVGGAGPSGGNGTGGAVQANAANGQIILGTSLTANADGQGGAANGGDGGDGTGGAIQFRALSGANAGRLNAGTVNASARGLAAGGANGGDARGGNIALAAQAGNAVLVFGATTANASGQGGVGTNAGGDAFGGNVFVGVEPAANPQGAGGSASYGTLALTANADGGAGTGTNGGDGIAGFVTIAAEGRPVTFTNATLAANGTGGAAGGLGFGGTLNLRAIGAGTLTGTGLTGTANGSGPLAAGNGAGRWIMRSENSVMRFATVRLDALVPGGTVGSISRLELAGGQIDITNTGAFAASPGIQIDAQGAGSLTGGDMSFLGAFLTLSHTGRPAVGSTVTVRNLTAQVGTFTANAGTTTRATQQVAVTADGTATIADLIAAPAIVIGSAAIDIAATGFLGDAGTLNTTLIARPAVGQAFPNQAVLGGTAEGPGWTLTNAEANRIRSATLAVQVQAAGIAANRAPDLLIRDLGLAVPGQGAGVNILQVSVVGQTPGIVSVEGALALANGGATSRIAINAAGRIEIVNPAGSIRLRDAAGLPVGTIQLSSGNVWSASQALIAQLRADPNFAGRNQALLNNIGPVQPRGYIEAADVVLQVGSTAFVQNSGTTPVNFGDGNAYAGILVSRNTLTITPTGAQPIQVFAFGRSLGANGAFSVNDVFFREVAFGRPNGQTTSYTTASELNQCVINTGACPARVPQDFGEPEGPEIIEGPVDGGEGILNLQPPNTDVIDTSFANEELIEEPVTSGAEANVWDCSDPDDERCRRRPRSEQ